MGYKSVLRFTRGITVLVTAGGLAVASVPVFSQSAVDGKAAGAPNYERMPRPIRPAPALNRFDKMAVRLKITPAQQSVWAQYRRSVEAQISKPPAPPATDADAITLLRWRADRTAEQARRMAAIADATDVLQRSLDVEQRKTLNELVREEHGLGGQGDRPKADQRAKGDGLKGDSPSDSRRVKQ